MIEADANSLTALRFLIVPILTLTLAELARLSHANLIDVLARLTAHGRGLRRRLLRSPSSWPMSSIAGSTHRFDIHPE